MQECASDKSFQLRDVIYKFTETLDEEALHQEMMKSKQLKTLGKRIIFIIPFYFLCGGKSHIKSIMKEMVENVPNCQFESLNYDELR